jgi:hypothetical protein
MEITVLTIINCTYLYSVCWLEVVGFVNEIFFINRRGRRGRRGEMESGMRERGEILLLLYSLFLVPSS